MNIKRLIAGGAAAASALILSGFTSPAWAASIVSNGSFENGTDPGVFTTVHPGDTNITDWTVVSGDVDYIGTYWQASDGQRSIDMTGDTPGAIRQTIPTIAGALYTVSFDLSGNPACGPSLKTLNVDTGGAPNTFTYDTAVHGNTLTDMMYEPMSFDFTATGTSTPLTFTSLTPGFCGPALDNVSVTQELPSTKDDCKHDGWKKYGVFKNQGDCVSFVATHGKNPPSADPLTF